MKPSKRPTPRHVPRIDWPNLTDEALEELRILVEAERQRRWVARRPRSPHTAKASRALAAALSVEVRWLPTATPELNACEGLWRGAKGSGLANRVSQSIDAAADAACRYLLALTPRQRLQQAGVLSGHFWLAT